MVDSALGLASNTWSRRLLKRTLSPAALLGNMALLLAAPSWLGAQEPELPPDSVAAEFQAALRGMGWKAAAYRMHPDALQRIRDLVSMLVEVDETGETRDYFFGAADRVDFRRLSSREFFASVMAVTLDELGGLLHAIVVRDVTIIGSVSDGPDLAHVVYSSHAELSGAEPEIRVMTMKRSAEGWRVLESQELEVIREALRGTPRRLRSAPPPR